MRKPFWTFVLSFDAAAILLLAALLARAFGPTWAGADGRPITENDLLSGSLFLAAPFFVLGAVWAQRPDRRRLTFVGARWLLLLLAGAAGVLCLLIVTLSIYAIARRTSADPPGFLLFAGPGFGGFGLLNLCALMFCRPFWRSGDNVAATFT